MSDKIKINKFDQIIMAMALYYEKDIQSEVVDIYHRLWSEMSVSDISSACSIWMKKNKWFPMASEILEIIDNLKCPKISIQSRSQQQWRVVLSSVRQRGFERGALKFEDPITADLIERQFTWSYLCDINEIDEKWEQKRWCEAFALASEIEIISTQIGLTDEIKKLVEPIGKIEK